ncbi:MAG: DUF4911 domain-containing protein [Mariprofundaceae bacterium]
MSGVNEQDVAIIVVRMPNAMTVRVQGILGGEDGLATMRCRDPERREQQLWSTVSQLKELRAWLDSLPPGLQVECLREEVLGERDCREG